MLAGDAADLVREILAKVRSPGDLLGREVQMDDGICLPVVGQILE
jgi:hypothetical protein